MIVAAPGVYTKDPAAVLDYEVDWSTWLGDDTIATSTWTVTDGDVTLGGEASTTTTAKVWVSAGTLGSRSKVTNQIVTTAGRTDERTITINVRDR